MDTAFRPRLGAWREGGGTRFRVWAPHASRVDLVLDRPGAPPRALEPEGGGLFTACFADVAAGDRYRFGLDGQGPFPDPASRFQPDGVHGPSMVVDASGFAWHDQRWRGLDLDRLVVYELHVGTFAPDGTFDGVIARLPDLADLGVTAIELMPVAEFPGRWNWGYDGAAWFSPSRAYGTPDDLRRLVDAAHQRGLGVILDVVSNHAGPDGAYMFAFTPRYFTNRHHTPWGMGINLDGDDSARVREFVVESACHWVAEYHIDGLRLDATHAIADDSPRHALAELGARVREIAAPRSVVVIAEDDRNLAAIVRPEAEGGWGLDAVWSDDFHHAMRRLVAGDADGYFRDFAGTTGEIATALNRGWLYTGQHSTHAGGPRGSDPSGIALERFVICIQNHDQVGNRAFGDRLSHTVDLATCRAMATLLLLAPETPLLFMGQEWAASTPFLYFTDHHDELGRQVTEGRRREFQHFAAFADPSARARIPDPQAESTFAASRLRWDEREREPHASTLRFHAALLRLRREVPALGGHDVEAFAPDDDSIVMRRGGEAGVVVVARLRGAGTVSAAVPDGTRPGQPARWKPLLTSEDAHVAVDAVAIGIDDGPAGPTAHFARPGAVVLAPAEGGR